MYAAVWEARKRLAESPTFWFYVPYTLTPNYSVEFVPKDNQDNTIYTNKVGGKGTPSGIVSLRLPSTVLLKAGKDYIAIRFDF